MSYASCVPSNLVAPMLPYAPCFLPVHRYTDPEKESIQDVLRVNLQTMIDDDWAVSPMFLRLMGHHQRAADVQTNIEDHLRSRSERKVRKIERAAKAEQKRA